MTSEERQEKLEQSLKLNEQARNLWSETYDALKNDEITPAEAGKKTRAISAISKQASLLMREVKRDYKNNPGKEIKQ